MPCGIARPPGSVLTRVQVAAVPEPGHAAFATTHEVRAVAARGALRLRSMSTSSPPWNPRPTQHVVASIRSVTVLKRPSPSPCHPECIDTTTVSF